MRRLPDNPSLEHLKNQAKDLHRSHRDGRIGACAEALRRLPRFADSDDPTLLASKLSLTEAQAALALDYGFASWEALREGVQAAIADRAAAAVPGDILALWAELIDQVSEAIGVPTTLMSRLDQDVLEVVMANASNLTRVGERERWMGSGSFCEQVLRAEQPVTVEDARREAPWRDQLAALGGAAAYLGFPVYLPSGRLFGTICAIDTHARRFSPQDRMLLRLLKACVEAHLTTLEISERQERRAGLPLRPGGQDPSEGDALLPVCSHCGAIRVRTGTWIHPTEPLADQGLVTHGICPDCYEAVWSEA